MEDASVALLWQSVLQTVALPTIRSVAFADERAAAALDTALVRTFAAAHGPPAPAPVEGKVSLPHSSGGGFCRFSDFLRKFSREGTLSKLSACHLSLYSFVYIFVYDTHSNDIMWCETICNSLMRI